MGCRVIGIGQDLAGDDGVGREVARRLMTEGVPEGVEVLEAPDGAALIDLLQTPLHVLLLDAVVGGEPPGTVVVLPEGAWPDRRATTLSSHGIGVAAAVGLARTLSPERMTPSLQVLGVAVAPPQRFTAGLSAPVAAAIPEAVRRCREILESHRA